MEQADRGFHKRWDHAAQETQRLCVELDITNADHIALWLENNMPDTSISWLAVQIAEAFDRAISRKHVSWGAAYSFAIEVAAGYGLIRGESDPTPTQLGRDAAALKARSQTNG